jgi:hypothetical protein
VSLVAGETERDARRRLRIISILEGAERAGLTPLPLLQLHTIAYFADALSPVWDLRILDAQLLKRQDGPMSPVLQAEVDRLVGRGIAIPTSVTHVPDASGWRLDASYRLNPDFAGPILAAVRSFDLQAKQLAFVQEVVYAVASLGDAGMSDAPTSDASYGSVMVDIGGLVDIEDQDGSPNETARVALRFGELMESEITLTDSEMVHLYVRQLYKRTARVA